MSAVARSRAREASKAGRQPTAAAQQRLQKVLAAAGLGSRRRCEQLIEQGRVLVDARVVTRLGTKVDPQCQEVRVDGEPIARPSPVYYAVHKPVGVLSTGRDPAGRPRVIDLVPAEGGHLFSVGRLDASSAGLILVTNDGQLTNELTHPRYGVEKTYHVEVAGHPAPQALARLRRGIHLAEGFARVSRVRMKRRRKMSTVLEIVLCEGRNREIRRVLARLGHKVQHLVRVAVGPVRLGDLPPGAYRALTRSELRALRGTVRQGRAGAPTKALPGRARAGPHRRRNHAQGRGN